jgi:SAM-dependent methyltransferase
MTQPTERPDPSAKGITRLYTRHAGAWDRARRATNFAERPWMERFAALLPPGGAVLDLGCGTGEPIARWFVDAGFSVTGVDGSAPLIALCHDRMPKQAWIVGDMRTIALARRFDGLVAWHSFFHLPHDDQRAMFGVFERHAAPRAALMFTSGPAAGEALGKFEGETLYHASLAPKEYRALLEGAGFEVLDFVPEDAATNGDTIWLARRRA